MPNRGSGDDPSTLPPESREIFSSRLMLATEASILFSIPGAWISDVCAGVVHGKTMPRKSRATHAWNARIEWQCGLDSATLQTVIFSAG
jgi:hypothetical protein